MRCCRPRPIAREVGGEAEGEGEADVGGEGVGVEGTGGRAHRGHRRRAHMSRHTAIAEAVDVALSLLLEPPFSVLTR